MHELYYNAIKADDAFHEACVKQFGKDAGDKRYQPNLFNNATRAAYETFRLANIAYSSANAGALFIPAE